MNCQFCGTAAAPGQRFCMACGQPLVDAAPAPPPYIVAAPGQSPSSRGPLTVIVMLLIVVLLGAGGFFAYRYYRTRAREVAQQAAPPPIDASAPMAAEPAAAQPALTAMPAVPESSPQGLPPVEQPTAAPRRLTSPPRSERRATPTPAVQSFNPSSEPAPAPTPSPAAAEPAPLPPAPVEQPTPAPPSPAPVRQRVEILKPQAEAPAPPPVPVRPSVPASGLLMWTGKLEKNGLITITGGQASSGSVTQGALPGVPVTIQVGPAEAVGVAEAPGPSNGWKKIVLRSRVNRALVVTIRWNTL